VGLVFWVAPGRFSLNDKHNPTGSPIVGRKSYAEMQRMAVERKSCSLLEGSRQNCAPTTECRLGSESNQNFVLPSQNAPEDS